MSNYPDNNALLNSFRLSEAHDKPIHCNYWTDSQNEKVYIGKTQNNEKIIYVDEEEYTSPIEKLYKIDNAYIIMTGNSIYIVNTAIQIKSVNIY